MYDLITYILYLFINIKLNIKCLFISLFNLKSNGKLIKSKLNINYVFVSIFKIKMKYKLSICTHFELKEVNNFQSKGVMLKSQL